MGLLCVRVSALVGAHKPERRVREWKRTNRREESLHM